jgi:hypothetical protein
MVREVYVDLLLNRRVRALNGRVIGRIEEIKAEQSDGAWHVSEYLIGSFVLLERLAGHPLGRSVLRFFRLRRKDGGYRVRWDQMDLSDPARPRLICRVEELRLIDAKD